MHAFIIRPFGIKQGVNFEKIQDELIVPALEKAGVRGYTTAAIVEAGNIRQDMFQLLLTSDLVIADISIHNANAFYELGIRHSLRDKKTFLIRCSKDVVPFDLKTDRYLTYDENNPSLALDSLTKGLRETIHSNRVDSPVFLMLPKLTPQDPEDFLAIPADFSEEAEVAKSSKQIGRLALLASEVNYFAWEIPALRLLGEIQYNLAAFKDARETWEKIRNLKPNDIDAHDRLATIYERLGEKEILDNPVLGAELFAKSRLAIDFLMDRITAFSREKRAEIYSLRARNNKASWIKTWINSSIETILGDALTSQFLRNAYNDYLSGFNEDLNHFYSGINALGLLKIIISLAEARPGQWSSLFDSDEEADFELKKHNKQFNNLSIIIQAAINAEKKALLRDHKVNAWVNITEADLTFLINNNPKKIENMYRMAMQLSKDLNLNSAKRQLLIYKKLNILTDNVDAALRVFENTVEREEQEKEYIILFSGHMIDKPDREVPRFPPDKEDEVRLKIKKQVQSILEAQDLKVKGIAGGACGGDILFHEVCMELGVKTEIYLALPREKFIVASVQFAGPQWVERFNKLYNLLPAQVLSETKELPQWLKAQENYTIWERNNRWILNSALSQGDYNLTFLALWNRKDGDGPGGTNHMIEEVQKRGAKCIIIDI
tara:strand:+ start:29040 stop:31028 length:1989 start_codon:yes stop_codon:yes gene_type:complete